MMTDPRRLAGAVRGLDHDEVHTHGQAWQRPAVRQSGLAEQAADRRAHVAALAMVERLLGQSEFPRPAPAYLNDDEFGGRSRVDRDEVQLRPPDVNVPAEDQPARRAQAGRDQLLGRIAGPLLGRPRA